LETEVDKLYIQNYQTVAGLITELKQKNKRANNDVQLATDSIYGFLLLKMKKSEISIATTEAIKRLSTWLKFLSKLYKDFEAGDLEF
jgi:ABC-type phosphate/phosphonate transport system permease subunit